MLSFHCNGSNSFLFVDAVKMFQFKGKNLEIQPHPLCLGSISKYSAHNKNRCNMKNTGLKGSVEVFSVNYNAINTSNISNMKVLWDKIMFGFIKKIFIRLLTNIVNTSNHTKFVSLNNQ